MTAATEVDAATDAGDAPTQRIPVQRRGGLLRGRPDDPRWVRPTYWAVLLVAAVTYLWNLGASGNANSFYAAAVQAGTQDWKAWLFGALDSANFITVDKPPASLWIMALSGRIFGFSSWSMLAPQALMGVATVVLVYATVRRWSGPRTALAAMALVAAMPIAVLMFKFNNPDAMLVLCMVAAAYVTVRAVDAAGTKAGTWWLVAAGALVGLGFLTKQLQVMLAVPALALVYVVVAPTTLRRRVLDLLAAGVAIVVSAGWYIALVELWPAASRPYIGGSTNNSLLELALGYNGLGRITGDEQAGPGAGGRSGGAAAAGGGGMPGGGMPGGGGMSGGPGFGSPSPFRLFTEQYAGNASWLLPAGLILLVAGLWCTRRAPRTDRTRGLLLLGGLWMVVHLVVFSAMSGIIHEYYTVALVPGVAITAAAGASILWRARDGVVARTVLALVVVGTAVWSAVLLTWAEWALWLRWVVVGAALLAAAGVLVRRLHGRRAMTTAVVVLALVGTVGASTAYAGVTALTPHRGAIVTAGPEGLSRAGHGPAGSRGPGGSGGPGDEQTSSELTALLQQAGTRWSAATSGANSAASLELASGTAVMGMGGFLGSDPAPTLQQFQQYVADGQVRYFVEGGGPGGGMRPPGAGGDGGPGGGRAGGGPGGQGTSQEITQWVSTHFTKIEVGGRTVYDLSRPIAAK